MVAAKQAERDRLREEELMDDSASEISTKEQESPPTATHLIPKIVIKTAVANDRTDSHFVKHSPKTYAKLSKKLADEVFQDGIESLNESNSNESDTKAEKRREQQEINRQNWRNKEIRPKALEVSTIADPNANNVPFTKTYSFRNLPKGRVAKLQQMFDTSSSPLNGTTMNHRQVSANPTTTIKERSKKMSCLLSYF